MSDNCENDAQQDLLLTETGDKEGMEVGPSDEIFCLLKTSIRTVMSTRNTLKPVDEHELRTGKMFIMSLVVEPE